LGPQERALYPRHFPGRTASHRPPDAGIAGWGLRRHDNPAWRNAGVDGASSTTCLNWFSKEEAALIQPHLPRGQRAGKMACAGRHHEPAHRLGAARAVEANLPGMTVSLTNDSGCRKPLIKLVAEHSP